MGLRHLMTAREIESLSLILINFNIPVLTPGLQCAKTVLEFSDNKPSCSFLHTDRRHQQRGLHKHQVPGVIIYTCCLD
jgi:hypothetical protein